MYGRGLGKLHGDFNGHAISEASCENDGPRVPQAALQGYAAMSGFSSHAQETRKKITKTKVTPYPQRAPPAHTAGSTDFTAPNAQGSPVSRHRPLCPPERSSQKGPRAWRALASGSKGPPFLFGGATGCSVRELLWRAFMLEAGMASRTRRT